MLIEEQLTNMVIIALLNFINLVGCENQKRCGKK